MRRGEGPERRRVAAAVHVVPELVDHAVPGGAVRARVFKVEAHRAVLEHDGLVLVEPPVGAVPREHGRRRGVQRGHVPVVKGDDQQRAVDGLERGHVDLARSLDRAALRRPLGPPRRREHADRRLPVPGRERRDVVNGVGQARRAQGAAVVVKDPDTVERPVPLEDDVLRRREGVDGVGDVAGDARRAELPAERGHAPACGGVQRGGSGCGGSGCGAVAVVEVVAAVAVIAAAAAVPSKGGAIARGGRGWRGAVLPTSWWGKAANVLLGMGMRGTVLAAARERGRQVASTPARTPRSVRGQRVATDLISPGAHRRAAAASAT